MTREGPERIVLHGVAGQLAQDNAQRFHQYGLRHHMHVALLYTKLLEVAPVVVCGRIWQIAKVLLVQKSLENKKENVWRTTIGPHTVTAPSAGSELQIHRMDPKAPALPHCRSQHSGVFAEVSPRPATAVLHCFTCSRHHSRRTQFSSQMG